MLAHLAWCALVALAAIGLVAAELSAACPPGGPLAFGACETVRPFAVAVVVLAAGLYLIGLTAVLAWTSRLRRQGADPRGARDWYLIAAALGLLAAPLLSFTTLSALR